MWFVTVMVTVTVMDTVRPWFGILRRFWLCFRRATSIVRIRNVGDSVVGRGCSQGKRAHIGDIRVSVRARVREFLTRTLVFRV